ELLADGFDPFAVGKLLDQGWRIKRKLASTITNPTLEGWYERALAAGAWGGKICGAGGGGFLLLVARPELHAGVRAALAELLEVPVGYEPHGSRVLMPHVE